MNIQENTRKVASGYVALVILPLLTAGVVWWLVQSIQAANVVLIVLNAVLLVVLFAGGEKTHMSYMGWGSKDIGQDTMTAFDTATGKKLWVAPHPYGGYQSPEDILVAGGLVWCGETTGGSGILTGRDPRVGPLLVKRGLE